MAAWRQLAGALADRSDGPANQLGIERVVGHYLFEPHFCLRLASKANTGQLAVRCQRALADLAALARAHNLPLFEDLGSGCLVDLNPLGIHDEPTVNQALAAGASVVAFSGDKLLGGPQAGLMLGEAELIQRIKRNPLMRALRVDKLIFAALEATVAAYASGRALAEIPTLAALFAPPDEVTRRARGFARRARKVVPQLDWQLRAGASVIGGGSAPETRLPTTLIAVTSAHATAATLEERLRNHTPPVIARIEDDQLVLDLRTVNAASEKELLTALAVCATESAL